MFDRGSAGELQKLGIQVETAQFPPLRRFSAGEGWGELRRCAFLESLHIGWNDGPRLRRSCLDMSGDLQPGWIVESAAGYPSGSGPSLHRPRNSGAASRAELQTEPAVRFVRAMFIRRQRAARELDVLELEQDRL